jgi:hypothetical protein
MLFFEHVLSFIAPPAPFGSPGKKQFGLFCFFYHRFCDVVCARCLIIARYQCVCFVFTLMFDTIYVLIVVLIECTLRVLCCTGKKTFFVLLV